MVGRDDQMKWMLKELTRYGGSSGELKVIPIVGMGGEILLSLWRCEKGENIYVDSKAELADMLQKSLKGKRYLIVLDDIWDSEAWDAVRLCFPSENNGSRILLTTRNTEVARCAGTKNLSLQMSFMDQHESWNLFETNCQQMPRVTTKYFVVAGLLKSRRTIEYWENVAKDVKSVTNDPDKQFLDVLGLSYNQLTSDLKACLLYFGIFPEDKEISAKSLSRFWMAEGFLKLENDLEGEAEKCLHELVDRCLVLVCKKSPDGTKIRSCKVHDLIHDLCLREIQRGNVFIMDDIGFEVSRAQRSMHKMHPFEKSDANHVPSEFLLSPMHMMQPFKKLDGKHFPSGSLISPMQMIHPFEKLDGKHFPSGSLISPMQMMQPFKKLDGKHFPSGSLISPLQMTHPFKSSISNAFAMYSSPRDLYRALLTPVHRQLRFHDDNNFVERTHSIFLFGRYSTSFNLRNFHYKLLKVLDLRCMHIYSFPEQIVSLIWLTYLALSFVREFHIPRAIYRLWNLQTFIAEGSNFAIGYFHEEIWGLTQLRHLELRTFYLPNLPDGSVNKGRLLDFPNIQTISYLSPRYCTKEVILGIQNAKKLGIRGDVDDFKSIQDSGLLNNLVHLQQLETLSLKLIFCPMSARISLGTLPRAKAFPATLKKLKLDGTWLSWSCLDIIAELPNLEVLKLMNAACCGEEWHPNVRGFIRLKLLHIIQHDLKYWEATHDNFPVLERLMLSGFRYLKEIPIEFAEINTLQQIVLRGCLPELGESAARIQKEQFDLGNKPIDVHFSDRWESDSYSEEY
ncbi:putative late blight resistance protein R1B-17 [Capsicum annuum]